MNEGSITFNARYTGPREVAKSFVVPPKFQEITKFENSVLVGPRGSGKTTILKVLTPKGLYYLDQREELKVELEGINVEYLPVYIPAEASWKGDTATIRKTIANVEHRRRILNGIFVDHSLRQIVSTLEDSAEIAKMYDGRGLPNWAIPINEDTEQEISRLVSELFYFDKIQSSFIGVKLALLKRANCYRAAITTPGQMTLDAAMNLPALDVLQMFQGVIDIVQASHSDLSWSFNFDEMEIAPRRVVSMLYENLRSWDPRACLKFSLFPYVDFYTLHEKMRASETGPVEGQDFQTYLLANDFTKTDNDFVKNMISAECKKIGVTEYDLARYLNSSSAIHKGTRRFEGLKSTRNYLEIFRRPFEQKHDPSFVQFVHERGFESAEDLAAVEGENNRARIVRKIAPICEFRNYYLTERRATSKKATGRGSPKGFGYYHGFNQIFALAEGNPRFIKFYANDLLSALQAGEKSASAQNRAIRRNVDRFRALIASQIVPIEDGDVPPENALNLVDQLGQWLVSEVLSDKFKSEPMLSVRFSGLRGQTMRIIEVAINAGAFVVDQTDNPSKLVFDVQNQRLRLSHSFAPFHPLPTITGAPMQLQAIPRGGNSFNAEADLFRWAA